MGDKDATGLLKAAPLLAALGDPIRLAMVGRLCGEGPLPTIRLQQGASVSRQAITKHLQVLEQTGLVCSERVGRDRQWRLQTQQLAAVCDCLERISTRWDHRLSRLRSLVEQGDA